MNADELESIAARLFDAFVAHDHDTVEAMMMPDAKITQNGATANVEQALVNIKAIRGVIGDHHYTDVRRTTSPSDNGDHTVVEEHRVVSTTPTGQAVDQAACVVLRVNAEGLITELDEYVDISSLV